MNLVFRNRRRVSDRTATVFANQIKRPNLTAEANAGGRRQLPIQMRQATRVAQLCR